VRSEGRCPVRRRQTPARFSAAAPSPRRSRNAAPDAGRTSRHRTAGQPRRCGQPGRPGDGAGHRPRRSCARRSCRASPPRSELRHAVMVPYAGRDIPMVVACLRRGGPDERRTAVGCGLVAGVAGAEVSRLLRVSQTAVCGWRPALARRCDGHRAGDRSTSACKPFCGPLDLIDCPIRGRGSNGSFCSLAPAGASLFLPHDEAEGERWLQPNRAK
jgi:hypothetical protein